MKLWIVGSVIFLSSIAHASFIIEPNENDQACSLAKRDLLTVDKKKPSPNLRYRKIMNDDANIKSMIIGHTGITK